MPVLCNKSNAIILSQTSRTESPDIVCAKRTKAIALQQITEIRAQLTESESGTKKSCWIRRG